MVDISTLCLCKLKRPHRDLAGIMVNKGNHLKIALFQVSGTQSGVPTLGSVIEEPFPQHSEWRRTLWVAGCGSCSCAGAAADAELAGSRMKKRDLSQVTFGMAGGTNHSMRRWCNGSWRSQRIWNGVRWCLPINQRTFRIPGQETKKAHSRWQFLYASNPFKSIMIHRFRRVWTMRWYQLLTGKPPTWLNFEELTTGFSEAPLGCDANVTNSSWSWHKPSIKDHSTVDHGGRTNGGFTIGIFTGRTCIAEDFGGFEWFRLDDCLRTTQVRVVMYWTKICKLRLEEQNRRSTRTRRKLPNASSESLEKSIIFAL